MGFTRTSEGRVFFKNADNDDTPHNTSTPSKDPVMPSDNTQMQMLMLLKSLNTKLKDTQKDNGSIKKQLDEYKATIKSIENKTVEQQSNYIDLEQKIARKSNETSKKSTRIEDSVKSTLKHLDEAKELVAELENKHDDQNESLEGLKVKLSEQKERDKKLLLSQKSLASKQKAQGEKMVDNVAAYVALTKRVSEAETNSETLDNKIEDANSKYLKLDRKIDKAIEDRNRILRKVDRIEQAVLETRDALNAKAMVLLTDQGAVAGVNMPQIDDKLLKTDPNVLNRRLQEEALMPIWRRPLRIQGLTLVVIIMAVMFLGWFINGLNQPNYSDLIKELRMNNAANSIETSGFDRSVYGEDSYDYAQSYEQINDPTNHEEKGFAEVTALYDDYSAPYQEPEKQVKKNLIDNDIDALDITNDSEMLAAFEEDPERVARRLNQIEPSSLTTGDLAEPPPAPKKAAVRSKTEEKTTAPTAKTQSTNQYINDLKKRIRPDNNLTDIAKKIESQAFEGVPEAQHDMGAIYVAGHGQISKNLKRAVLWFREASNNGVANAKYNLGVLYHQGMGVDQSIDEAMNLYKEAAKLGHPEALYNLGIAHIEGIGVEYNPSQAAYFFETAANHDVVEAAYNLGLIYENGLLGETKPDEALAWYKYAADKGSPEANSALNQLAASLGIGINDVNKIVEKIQLEKAQNNSEKDNVDSYMIFQVQKELMRRGLYPGPVDGVTGPMTEDAIKKFQADANLAVNGKASDELLSYLRASL